MKFFILFTILIGIYKIKSDSLLTGSYDQNSTVLIKDKQAVKEIDVLRQIINQETIIRLTLDEDVKAVVKDVKALVNDMDSLKRGMASMETTLASLKENNTNIYKELNNSISRTTEKDSIRSCEKEWINYQEDCYYFSTSTASFLDAMDACHLMDAEMILLQNAEEEKWLDFQFRLRGYPTSGHVWLGATDIQQEGTFISVSNGLGLHYNHWVGGQPDNAGGREHCTTYWITHKGMNDIPCDFKLNYVCKTNILKKILTQSTSKGNNV